MEQAQARSARNQIIAPNLFFFFFFFLEGFPFFLLPSAAGHGFERDALRLSHLMSAP
jgi:hypothetical protein